MSNKWAALGSQLSWNAAAVLNLTKIDGPALKNEFADVTSLDSAGGSKLFIPTLQDPGEINCEGIWDPTDTVHKAIHADANAATRPKRAWVITETATGSPTAAGNGYIAEFEPKRDLKDAVKFVFKIRITGPVTLTSE